MDTQTALSRTYVRPLLERFLRYVRIHSTSSSEAADQGIQPSTPQQRDFAAVLADDMRRIGIAHVQVTDWCYVYGTLPATPGYEAVPSIGLISHMDTVDEVSGKDVRPIVHEQYDGKPLALGCGITLDPQADRALAQAAAERDTVITADGTTLLGADDKAGVAEILTAAEYLVQHTDVPHGKIEILLSPDEETGHGMDHVPLDLLGAKQCYTVDGGHIGELETECFNAVKTDVVFTGKSMHTGSARPGMVNAVCMAAAFVAAIPRHEMPETTDGYMGFYAPMTIQGTMEQAAVSLILRDFDADGMERRKALAGQIAQVVAQSFGGTATVTHTKQYENMRQALDRHPQVVANLVQAYKDAGVTPVFPPIRGGTDGSRLTEMGIPTPNIFTGGHNFHSRMEWASLGQMSCATQVLIQLCQIWARG